ncbi:hypothetical protein [Pseudoclavibacter sp. AY1F1]|uniref:hypothetical protein n=1 Tax=Pseudoclavibacter sp. AY1F1 TaxID=2080583 RepID=UPI0011B03100|nr:hypothetical protein [Pseudoclavibacter sp. AY1F1]
MVETVLNPRPHPRVLICVSDSALAGRLQFFDEYNGTVDYVGILTLSYLGEYDLVVVDQPLASFDVVEWDRLVDVGPNVIYLQPTDGQLQDSFDYLVDDEDYEPDGYLHSLQMVPGREVSMPSGLPDELQRLVKSDLAGAVDARQFQFGIRSDPRPSNGSLSETVRPFLIGPDGLILAGEYQRATGVYVWVLPADLPDFRPWIDVAFSEWSKLSATRFPAKPNWIKSEEWRTRDEADAAAAIVALDRAFEEATLVHQAERVGLLEKLAHAERLGAGGERRLISAQGSDLEDAVSDALLALGFTVRNMDETWPVDARREDFRVTRAEESDWLAIVEVTGTTRGVKDEKINSLRDHAEDYMAEEKPDTPPSKWLVVNREIKRDPNTRGSFVREDRLRTTSKNGVLILDSVAVFKLVRFVQTNPHRSRDVRDYLRSSTGGIEMRTAQAWIAEQTQIEIGADD